MSQHPHFTLADEQEILELNTRGRLFKHDSGAKVLFLQNDDENKVFTVAFKTVPEDETGVAHILEHSVLCGSRKYPVKEPFVELMKSSMASFLNAMTYPDKTVYPVASCNEEDFHNLMDVYLDAVFFPEIKEEMFLQEGWHYRFDEAGELGLNGVVFNEMKGVFSSPESVLHRSLQKALFPDSPYAQDSGGYPASIPELSYEKFCDFHKKHYHPSNAIIIVWGDFDDQRVFSQIHDEYLAKFTAQEIVLPSLEQKALTAPNNYACHYSVDSEVELKEKTFILQSWALGDTSDPQHDLEMSVLDEVLLGSPAAPLRKALDSSGLGGDTLIYGYDDGLLQGCFSVGLRDSDIDKSEAFLELVNTTLSKIVEQGIDSKLLEAAVNSVEFKIREANFGSYPKGLVYSLSVLKTALHGSDFFSPLRFEKPLAQLKKSLLSEGYLEKLIEKYFLKNSHCSLTTCAPSHEEAARLQELEQRHVKNVLATASEEELEEIRQIQGRLKELQNLPDSAEALATIPKVQKKDLAQKATWVDSEINQHEDWQVLSVQPSCNGIIYLSFYLNSNQLSLDDLRRSKLLASLLRRSGTEKQNFSDLEIEISRHTGGISISSKKHSFLKKDAIDRRFCLSVKCTIEKLDESLALVQEILLEAELNDELKIRELLARQISQVKASFKRGGENMAMRASARSLSKSAALEDYMTGHNYLAFLEAEQTLLKEDFGQFRQEYLDIKKQLLNSSGLLVTLACDERNISEVQEKITSFVGALPKSKTSSKDLGLELISGTKAFATSSEVQYVARSCSSKTSETNFSGSFEVLRRLLSSSYLWEKVRVQGGAYGCFLQYDSPSEVLALCSYRDPKLRETLAIYEGIAKYIKDLDIAQDDIDAIIVSTVGKLDQALTANMQMSIALRRYLDDISLEEVQLRRDEIINSTLSDLQQYASWFELLNETGLSSVYGNKAKVEEAKELFDEIKQID